MTDKLSIAAEKAERYRGDLIEVQAAYASLRAAIKALADVWEQLAVSSHGLRPNQAPTLRECAGSLRALLERGR